MDRHRLLSLFDKIHTDYKLKDNDYKVFVEALGGKKPVVESFADVSLAKLIYRKYTYELPSHIKEELEDGDRIPFRGRYIESELRSQIFQIAEEDSGLSLSQSFLESRLDRDDFKDIVSQIDNPFDLIRSKKKCLIFLSDLEWIVPLKYEILSRDVYLSANPMEIIQGVPPNTELRFKVGDRVKCNYSVANKAKWCPGTVVELWYRESDWEPEDFVPYSIKLDNGEMIFAPDDTDQYIRPESFVDNDQGRLQSSSQATTSEPDRRSSHGRKKRR